MNGQREKDKNKIILMLQRRPFIGNPFSSSKNDRQLYYDDIGFALLFFLWWVGFALGIYSSSQSNNRILLLPCLVMAYVYSKIGLITRNAINASLYIIKPGHRKHWPCWRTYVTAIVFLIIISWLNYNPYKNMIQKWRESADKKALSQLPK